ncbi:MAG: hypothetical protein E8D52_03255 [Nitrospira sp.]|nr:MAG: hypothetical protein E8D52_03255 [Nitrospira sp.]
MKYECTPIDRQLSASSGSSVPRSHRHKAVLCPVAVTFAITGPIERTLSYPATRLPPIEQTWNRASQMSASALNRIGVVIENGLIEQGLS